MPDNVPDDPLLVVLLGPTSSAKTSLSIAVAEHFRGEIVNCDSVAMYREFEIGTAKPTQAQRSRAPHHLFDFVEPDSYITAGEYSAGARRVLGEIKLRGALPIVVGGTGIYHRALLEGLFSGPRRSEYLRDKLRERAEARGGDYLHRVLTRLDRTAAEKIHANDTPKLIRAIEVCLTSRKKMSELWQTGREPLTGFRVLRLGLDPPRQELYDRINRRAAQMFDEGLVEETRRLRDKYGERAAPLTALGYRQVMRLIHHEIDYSTAVQATQQAHRNYAKRQMTWFRREPDVVWLKGFGDEVSIQQEAIAIIANAIQAR
ncbi:MAG: tRNA (adenosine(37)-N6)-dimethylallyltransferase MiaA [Terriglobales bacterium]